MKIYIGNLPYGLEETELEELFSKSGEILSVSIIKDRETGRSKGFGFVEYKEQSSSENAISEFNGYELNGRNLKVSEAKEKSRSGGGGGGGGGFRRGRGGNGGGRR
ncbi:MAG: RNA-binding protein [Bdellovibrionales bacterium]|nr:RNA-binding protein [Bdellovibrionales bacterium]